MFVLCLFTLAAAQWTALNFTVGPDARSGHSLLTYSDSLVLFGGCGSVCFNDVMLYSLTEATWRRLQVAGLSPPPREGHSANIVSNVMYIFGGASTQSLLSDLWAFDLVSVRSMQYSWTQMRVAGTAEPRAYHGAALTNSGNLVVFGGQTARGLTNEVLILDLLNSHWGHPSLSGTHPSARKHHSFLRLHNGFWAFGGYDGSRELQDLYRLDLDDLSWREVATAGGPLPRQGHAAIANGNQMYISGGCDSQSRYCFADLYRLDVETLVWQKAQQSGDLTPRESHAMTTRAGQLYIFGGSFFLERVFNDFLAYGTGDLCPNKCGNGQCTENGCMCPSGAGGSDCQETVKCRYSCYGRGRCSGQLQCECYPGYSGAYCQFLVGCPLNCTSERQGVCQANGNCRCTDGYTGEDCAVAEPWRRCLDRCKNGKCQDTECVCDNGWIGIWCDLFSPVLYEPNRTRVRRGRPSSELEEVLEEARGGAPVEVSTRSRQSQLVPEVVVLTPEQMQELAESAEGANDADGSLSDENSRHRVTHEMFGLSEYNTPNFWTTTNVRGGRRVRSRTPNYIDERLDDQRDWDGLSQCDDHCSYHGLCSDSDCYCENGYTGDRCEKEDDDLHSDLRLSTVLRFDFFIVYLGFLIYGTYKLSQIMKRIRDSERNKFPQSTEPQAE